MERRKLLMAGIGTVATATSGCLGAGSDSPTDDGDSGPPQDTAGGDATDESGADGPDDDIGNYDPEDVAETYYEALNDGDETTANDLSHSSGVVIHTNADRAAQYGDDYNLTIQRTDVAMENLAYFYQPSAVVEIGFEQERQEASVSRVTRDEVVLVVEDGELLVYDTKGQDRYLRDGGPVDSCRIESDSDVLDLLPHTTESFYEATRRETFGNGRATYRGPDGNWFWLEIEVHDSEEEAAELEADVDVTNSHGDGEWTTEAALLARNGTMTCDVSVANADATDQVEALYQETGCFSDDHVVERSW